MATQPKMNPQQKAMQKAALLQAVSQLDMMVVALTSAGDCPERVLKASEEFKEALSEWANG